MIGAAKQMLLAIAALSLSAGHAACACLSAGQDIAPLVQPSMSDADHAHHHVGNGAGDTPDPSAPSPPGNCSHCETAALAGDGSLAAGSLPALQKMFAVAVSPAIASTPLDRIGALARRLHWAAPPRRTPGSLKNRLRF